MKKFILLFIIIIICSGCTSNKVFEGDESNKNIINTTPNTNNN